MIGWIAYFNYDVLYGIYGILLVLEESLRCLWTLRESVLCSFDSV